MSNWLETNCEDRRWNQTQSGFSFEDDLNQCEINLNIPENTVRIQKEEHIETIQNSIVKLDHNDTEIESLIRQTKVKTDNSQPSLHKDLVRIIREIINGQNYYLHHIKSKADKIKLLELAIDSCDGDAILTIILFMKQTMNSKIFKNEIINRSQAIDQYINYLKLTNQSLELINFQSMLGRSEDAAITAYIQAIRPKLVSSKISNLKRCRDFYCNNAPAQSELKLLSDTIMEQVSLLERQQPIECEDRKTEDTQLDPNSMFVQIPRNCLLNQSVISTLEYCCMYHYDVPVNFFASPDAIRTAYALDPMQYTWTCLRALAKCHRWTEIDSLFETKTLLGKKKLKSIVPFAEVVKVLHQNEAPADRVLHYLNGIEDAELKIALAKEFKYHTVVLELCFSQKDRLAIEEYLPKLNPNSQEHKYAMEILSKASIKWKN